jgi:hypothetical protein
VTLREFATNPGLEKRAFDPLTLLVNPGTIVNLGMYGAGRLFTKFPKLKNLPFLGRAAKGTEGLAVNLLEDSFRSGLRGEKIREFPAAALSSYLPGEATALQWLNEQGLIMRSKGYTEHTFRELPKRLRTISKVIAYATPAGAAGMGAGVGAMFPKQPEKMPKELQGMEVPGLEPSQPKRLGRILIGAGVGGLAGAVGGKIGATKYLSQAGPFKDILSKLTGAQVSSEAAAKKLEEIMGRKRPWAVSKLHKVLYKRRDWTKATPKSK